MFIVWLLICPLSASRFSSSLFPSSCPGAPGAVFCGFFAPAPLCALKDGASHSDVVSALTLRRCALYSPHSDVVSALMLEHCALFSPHSDVASAPTFGLWALISRRLNLSASWSDWRLDWTDPLFLSPFFVLNYGFRLSVPAEFCVLRI